MHVINSGTTNRSLRSSRSRHQSLQLQLQRRKARRKSQRFHLGYDYNRTEQPGTIMPSRPGPMYICLQLVTVNVRVDVNIAGATEFQREVNIVLYRVLTL